MDYFSETATGFPDLRFSRRRVPTATESGVMSIYGDEQPAWFQIFTINRRSRANSSLQRCLDEIQFASRVSMELFDGSAKPLQLERVAK